MEKFSFHRRDGINALNTEEIHLAFVQCIHWQHAEQWLAVEHHALCPSVMITKVVLYAGG